jgi:hypothetical protein
MNLGHAFLGHERYPTSRPTIFGWEMNTKCGLPLSEGTDGVSLESKSVARGSRR